MTFLPIVERELRAAARRKSTYRLRWWTAVIAMAITTVSLLLAGLSGGRAGFGNPLFNILTGFAFGLCLLAGIVLTADCLTEEKRQGTLGLLFLTDLKGYDVVLGKFMATSLNALFGLLALVPVTGLPLLLGGVTGAEFWRTALALMNALFFSLTIGICISAFVRDGQTAVRNSFGLVVLLVAALPALARLGAGARSSWLWWWLAGVSPIYPFAYARDPLYLSHSGRFWGTLAASQLLGWSLLALASYVLPRRWQENPIVAASKNALDRLPWRNRRRAARAANLRARLLPTNPVLWLVERRPGLRSLAWMVVLTWGVVVFAMSHGLRMNLIGVLYPGRICGFLLKVLVAFQACRFFIEARRSGALELLLCTPLRGRDIIKGQWLAIMRTFLWPVILSLVLNFVLFGVHLVPGLRRPGPNQVWFTLLGSFQTVLLFTSPTLGLVLDMVTVACVGMWLALSMKKPALAPALTILFVLVLPSIAVCGTYLAVDIGLILWSVTKLQQDFRWVLARQYQSPVIPFAPQPQSLPPGVPPVIRT